MLEKIVLEWHGTTLMEPVVFITNWMITIQCFFYYIKLRKNLSQNQLLSYWRYFFLLFGTSTFFGGLSHLLFHYFVLLGKIPGWSLAILAITSIEFAVLHSKGTPTRTWSYLIWLKTAVIFALLIIDFQFLWVSVQTALGLVLVLGTFSIFQMKRGNRVWKGFLYGIGWMLLSVPVNLIGLDLSVWFNRHDVSHLLMMLCLYQFYGTVLKIHHR